MRSAAWLRQSPQPLNQGSRGRTKKTVKNKASNDHAVLRVLNPSLNVGLLHLMSFPLHHDELTSTVCGAIQQLNQHRKANFLLDTALALIEGGQ